MRARRCTLFAVMLATATASDADEIFQVNSYTTGPQSSVSAICEAGGGYLVTWLSGARPGIVRRRRRLALNGHPVGTEYAISNSNAVASGTTAARPSSQVAFDLGDQGLFVVASWTEDYVDGCAGRGDTSTTTSCGDFSRNSWVSIQRFASEGMPVGTEIVRQTPGNENQFPDVAMLPGADFVVAWHSCYSEEGEYMARPCSGNRVVAEAFDASGQSRFARTVSDIEASYGAASRPKLAGHEDGSFSVVWGGRDLDASSEQKVLASRYENDGTPRFTELDIADKGFIRVPRPDVTAGNGGDFLAVWDEPVGSGDSDVFARRVGTALPTDSCPAEPAPACRSAAEGLGRLLVRAGNMPDRQPRLRWIWAGRTPSADSFLDPRDLGTTYRFCIYDGSANQQPFSTTMVASGGSEWARPRRRLFVYDDPQRSQDGVRWMRLRAGAKTTTRNKLRAGGGGAILPALPLQPPVLAQLFVSDGSAVECWQASYAAPQRNDADVFRQGGASAKFESLVRID